MGTWRQLLDGLTVSVELTVTTLAVGIPLGLLLAVAVGSKSRPIRWFCIAFAEIGRGLPWLVLLQIFYFGLPEFHITLGAMLAATVGTGWGAGAFMSEIIRAGLDAVPEGQREAAAASGLAYRDILRYVVIPQGIRIALPPLIGFAIMVFQGTSLAFTIAVPELLSHAYGIGATTFRYLNVLIMAGILYAVIIVPCALMVGRYERQLRNFV
ncbi:amino acid ABC transporter permease [Leekyejoonella antrihumi]|uniref:Amino acid ABC transporter permease n=1 Tax=Leekyejoonella antrihumi TaxID=1660198 RepID=A0A563DQC1_9MICO|nr:amino acid ABC transporter permease [Leekyejoonella antrihumi]TWP32376.1 amino acid ABC transporter permease [Leekyejoonella antrihumi]